MEPTTKIKTKKTTTPTNIPSKSFAAVSVLSKSFAGSRKTIVVTPEVSQHLKVLAAKKNISMRRLVDDALANLK